VTDSYFTDARRRDPRAANFEPYRGHRLVEVEPHRGTSTDVRYHYAIQEHGLDRHFATPASARSEVDRCMVRPRRGCVPGETEYLVKPGIFERFER